MKIGFVLVTFICVYSFAQSCLACETDCKSRQELINILNGAIEINEEFKKLINIDQFSEYQEKRKQVEKYYEEILTPRFEEYLTFITQKKDIDLSVFFLKMVLSYQNSADERLAYICCKLFLKSPNFIIEILKKLTDQERKYLYSQIEFGWEQILVTENLSGSEISGHNADLRKLKRELGVTH